ncbi:CIC11C00000003616 [Sungouiella intermedia]|uniref:CIC11C00000003616 n=1 Tax=Sungouiella intermedia TaxID=45354 RepID=A0A1L0BG06_9ASCO|nr:CIC11C00000003616 [[Candida] intermedia]
MKLVLVGIGGPSSSGKTTVAKALHLLFSKSTLIHLDDFYFPDDEIPYDSTADIQNWDCEEAIDWVRFKEYIAKVRETNGAMLPMDSLEVDSELKLTPLEIDALKHHADAIESQGYHVVFVDGFMLYHDKAILELFDVKLFFHAPYKVLKERREARKGYNTVAGFWEDPPGYFDKIVWPEFIRSHSHLFEDGNVEGALTTEYQNLGLADVANDGSKSLAELIKWSMDQVTRQIADLGQNGA